MACCSKAARQAEACRIRPAFDNLAQAQASAAPVVKPAKGADNPPIGAGLTARLAGLASAERPGAPSPDDHRND